MKRRILISMGMLLALLILLAAWQVGAPNATASPLLHDVKSGAGAQEFVGTWRNVDPNTGGMTRIEITRSGNNLNVHSWGACTPTECDHGTTTVKFHGNPVVLSRTFNFKRETLMLALLTNGELWVVSDNVFTDGTNRDYVSQDRFRKEQLVAPRQTSPANGTVFNNYPRTTTLRWQAVPGAAKYTVEVDCFQCCQANRWCTDVGRTFKVVPNVSGTSYTFDFVGAQPGRWRVWAVNAAGTQGPKSGWWEFRYTR